MNPPDEMEPLPLSEVRRYEAARQRYRVFSAWYWLVFLGYIPGVLLFGWLLSFAVNDNLAHGIVAFGWLGLWMITREGYVQFRCPRCEEKFFARKGFATIFTNECLNCGLRTYAHDRTVVEDEIP